MIGAEDRSAQPSGFAGSPPAPLQPQGISAEQLVQLLGALFAVIVVSYLLLQQKGPEITPQDLQLLSNETRSGILHELEVADKIPTDLSNKLGKSKATVVEHLETLSSAGFVEKISTPGKKYVFYRLTRKGKVAILRKAA
jgi:DNA-binding MarR family transcriptional regulator